MDCVKTKLTVSELLLLPDGRILAQNITPAMAKLLSELNPEDELMRERARAANVGQASSLSKEPLKRKIDRRDAYPTL
jgi:hypothetical protein